MSKGPGRIERAIADTFTANSTRIFTVEQLAAIAYRGTNRIDKKHRVGTIRAADKVAERLWWACRVAGVPTGPLIYYNLCDVRSYTMAKMVCANYARDWQNIDDWFDSVTHRQSLCHSLKVEDMEPGGAWHDHVQINIAGREGRDPEPAVMQRQEARNALGRAYGFR